MSSSSLFGVQPQTIQAANLTTNYSQYIQTYNGSVAAISPANNDSTYLKYTLSGTVNNLSSSSPQFTLGLNYGSGGGSSYYTHTAAYAPGTSPFAAEIDLIFDPGTAQLVSSGAVASGFRYLGSVLNADGTNTQIAGFLSSSINIPTDLILATQVSLNTLPSGGTFNVYVNEMKLVPLG